MATATQAPPDTDVEPDADGPIGEALKDAVADGAAKGRLFDAEQYNSPEIRLDPIDGETIDKLHVQFGGLVRLERSNTDHVQLIRDLKMGTTIHLLVEVEVGPPNARYTTNKDGDLDALSLGRNFKVIDVTRPRPEDL